MRAMNKIYKYLVKPGTNKIELPKHSTILTAKEQYENAYIWVEFNEAFENDTESRIIKAVMTGDNSELGAYRYIDTVMLGDGRFVIHVYEKAKQI